jgi:polyisoprenoid-binding protein YceI
VHAISIRSEEPAGDVSLESGRGTLVIPVGSLRTGQLLQDLELRRQLQARRHPTIDAVLHTLARNDDGTYSASGDITFMGVTASADGMVTITEVDDGLTIAGEAVIDVTAFEFTPPNVLGLKVDPHVTVRIDLHATPAPAP